MPDRSLTGEIRFIALDVGGVIYREMIASKLDDLARKHRLDFPELRGWSRELRPAVDLGTLPESGFWATILRRAGVEPTAEDLDCEPYFIYEPGALEALDRLARRYTLAILSNDSIDLSLARRSRLTVPISTAVISAEHGVVKPDPAIYRILLERLDAAPESCLFVDDREENIAGAIAVGMRGIVFTTWEKVMGEMERLM